MICARRRVTKLMLGKNALGDVGCVALFEFLRSEVGRTYAVSEINLSDNGIGDRGMKAIAEYVAGNVHLKELYLLVLAQQEFRCLSPVRRMFPAVLH